MRIANREESIKVIKTLLKLRLRAKGFFNFNDKWLDETATKLVDEMPQGEQIKVLNEKKEQQ